MIYVIFAIIGIVCGILSIVIARAKAKKQKKAGEEEQESLLDD